MEGDSYVMLTRCKRNVDEIPHHIFAVLKLVAMKFMSKESGEVDSRFADMMWGWCERLFARLRGNKLLMFYITALGEIARRCSELEHPLLHRIQVKIMAKPPSSACDQHH